MKRVKLTKQELAQARCPHCISRKKIGICACSDHCTNHIFYSHDEKNKIRRAIKKAEKLRLEKVNKQRPKVVKYE